MTPRLSFYLYTRLLTNKLGSLRMRMLRKFTDQGKWIRFATSVFLTLLSFTAQAQFRETPRGTAAAEPKPARALRTEALTLPFFDDFSLNTNGLPDPVLWQNGGGAVVNNTLAVAQPSVNVVTFDGLKRSGSPYDFLNPLSQGSADSLTSQPIDLSALSARDSLYLSFFWEAKGLGELPDREDSLQVDFRLADGTWQPVWWQRGGIAASNRFAQVLLPLRTAAYFHAGFQFRFRAFGRESGAFDTWHVDYVYLNRGRRASDRFYKDLAVRSQPSSYLRRYRAMPLAQFLAKSAAETADSLKTEIGNLFNNNNFTTLSLTVRDLVSGQLIQQTTTATPENIGAGATQTKGLKLTVPTLTGTRAVLEAKFDLLTTDDQNPSIPGVNLKRNDTISLRTVLDDYYAYDDGTAEYSGAINGRLGRVAVRFVGNRPDVVGAVRVNLAPNGRNLGGQNFTLQILGDANGRPGAVLGAQSFAIRYPAQPNDFVELKLTSPVAVRDTFYVGWLQLSENDALQVGLDKNTDFGTQLFYNLGAGWAGNTELRGSFLLRPVMGGQASGVVTETEAERGEFRVFPNPSTGLIEWNDEAFQTLDVFSLGGQLLKHQSITGQRGATLSELPPGLYLLRFRDQTRQVTKRLLLVR